MRTPKFIHPSEAFPPVTGSISATELKRLTTIAELIDREALSWSVAFAGSNGDEWIWDDRDPDTADAHARVIRLESAATFLRKLSLKMGKSNETALPSAGPTNNKNGN